VCVCVRVVLCCFFVTHIHDVPRFIFLKIQRERESEVREEEEEEEEEE